MKKDIKAKPDSNYKAGVLKGLKDGISEVNLIKQGKLKGTPAKELLDEL
jgi:hypothetical protein